MLEFYKNKNCHKIANGRDYSTKCPKHQQELVKPNSYNGKV